MTNLVIARPGTKVLELHSPRRRGVAYWQACLNALPEIAGVR
jgi:hypothetical protein